MKKIVKEPLPAECEVCGCIFNFEEEDVERSSKMRPSWLFGLPIAADCKVVKCPACGNIIILSWLN